MLKDNPTPQKNTVLKVGYTDKAYRKLPVDSVAESATLGKIVSHRFAWKNHRLRRVYPLKYHPMPECIVNLLKAIPGRIRLCLAP